jgi:hypothetical protein
MLYNKCLVKGCVEHDTKPMNCTLKKVDNIKDQGIKDWMHTRYQDEANYSMHFSFTKQYSLKRKKVSKIQHLQKYIINVEAGKEYGNIFSL